MLMEKTEYSIFTSCYYNSDWALLKYICTIWNKDCNIRVGLMLFSIIILYESNM
jgi:hypothetical protein